MWISDIKSHPPPSWFGSIVCLSGCYFNKAWGGESLLKVTYNKKTENKQSDPPASPEEYMEAANPVNLKEANETLSAGERTVSQHYNSKLQMIS